MARETIKAKNILTEATATGAGEPVELTNTGSANHTFQATLDADSTTPAANVDIEVSNDNSTWIVMGTISVSGNSDTDGFASSASWRYARANVTDINDGGGTAAVTVTIGG